METVALPDDPDLYPGMIREPTTSLRDAHRQVEQLGHRLDLLLRRLYGPRSERVDPDQLLLFADQAEDDPGVVPAFESPAEPLNSLARSWDAPILEDAAIFLMPTPRTDGSERVF